MKIKVGLTYDLKDDYLNEGLDAEQLAELDKPQTIEGIENALRELGFETERIGNANKLMAALSQGKRWDIVFNIAEGLYGYAREALVPAILENYRIPYTFSDPLTLSICLHKAMTKIVVQNANVPTAKFWMVEEFDDIENIATDSFPLFAKPVAEGSGKGIDETSVIHSKSALRDICQKLLTRFKQPVLVEEYLPGREFTVGIIGTGDAAQCVGVLEIHLNEKAEKNAYSYANKQEYQIRVSYDLLPRSPLQKQIEKVALDSWKALNCKDAGRIDIRLDSQGNPMFMEVNPLAGLNPIDSDLPIVCRQAGVSYVKLIDNIMQSACKRYQLVEQE